MTPIKGQVKGFTAMTMMIGGDELTWQSQEEDGPIMPDVYPTELEVQKEIARDMIIQMQQFIDGERDYEEVDWCPSVYPVGIMYDEHDNLLVYKDGVNLLCTTLIQWRESL